MLHIILLHSYLIEDYCFFLFGAQAISKLFYWRAGPSQVAKLAGNNYDNEEVELVHRRIDTYVHEHIQIHAFIGSVFCFLHCWNPEV